MDYEKMFNEDFLNTSIDGSVDQLQGLSKNLEGLKNNLSEMMLQTFGQVFELEDDNGKPIYLNLKKPEIEELLDNIDNAMVPLFEEGKFEKGLKKCKEYKKLLQERLEEQK